MKKFSIFIIVLSLLLLSQPARADIEIINIDGGGCKFDAYGDSSLYAGQMMTATLKEDIADINFTNLLMNCGSAYCDDITIETNGNEVNIFFNSPGLTSCSCYFDISFKFGGLMSGVYNFKIYEKYMIESGDDISTNEYISDLKYDITAELIDNKTNFLTLKEPVLYSYKPVVSEGKAWYYYEKPYCDLTSAEFQYRKLFISGEEEIDGKMYKKCWYVDPCLADDSQAILLCYLREEDKMVYMRPTEESEGISLFMYSYSNIAYLYGGEIMIYDFNTANGYDTDPSSEGLEIESIEYVTIEDKLRKQYNFDGFSIIEGIGIIGKNNSGTGYVCSPFPTLPSCMGVSTPQLQFISTSEEEENECLQQMAEKCESLTVANIYSEQYIDIEIISDEIVAKGDKLQLEVHTLDGIKLAEATGESEARISTAELPIGIYMVSATDVIGHTLSKKIVVK